MSDKGEAIAAQLRQMIIDGAPAMFAELNQVKAENAALRSQLEEHVIIIDGLAALKADAERYRWLRANAVREKNLGDKFIEFHCDFESWNDVDAAIDAAREQR